MRNFLFVIIVFLYTACTLPEKKKANQLIKKSDTTVIETSDVNAAIVDTSSLVNLPVVKKVKSPNGIYRTSLPLPVETEQTIAFNKDFTYLLQEKYTSNDQDSVVVTEGTWTPSDGVIWLYKDQIVRGRYKWKGDVLQYYSPLIKKNFPMKPMQDAVQNTAWKNKNRQGVTFYGIGTEPFWNIELNNKDSISFSISEWNQPIRFKIDSFFNNNDSVSYTARTDSVQIRVTIFPHFCSDGMSDFIYRNRVKVHYNQQIYNGCGVAYPVRN